MDIGKIFEGLNEDYKDIILAIALGFPVAYMDCWKLHAQFREFDMFPQIILSLGVDLIFVGLGIIFCVSMWRVSRHTPNRPPRPEFNIIMLLMAFVASSGLTMTTTIQTTEGFRIHYVAYFIFLVLLQFSFSLIYKRRKIKQDKCSHNDNSNI